MKITCTRRDEVLREKADRDRRKSEYEAEWKAATQPYFDEVENIYQNAKQQVLDAIGPTKYPIDVEVSPNIVDDGFRIHITRPQHDNVSLRWDYDVKLTSDGDVKRESGSWSGIDAVTADQIDDLKESTHILETLMSVDWASILGVEMPNWEDVKKPDIPDLGDKYYPFELVKADIEDSIGTDNIIEGIAGENTYYRAGLDVYYMIVGDTGSQYRVRWIPLYYTTDMSKSQVVDFLKSEDTRVAKTRISKDKLAKLVKRNEDRDGVLFFYRGEETE